MKNMDIFEINEYTLPVIRQMAEHMPGGFFIYHAKGDEEFILINHAMLKLTACKDMEEFKEWTGNSFRGFVHPDDIEKVEASIKDQIGEAESGNDYVEYRIRCRDGSEKWLCDYGHFTHTEAYGDVFYVFVDDATEKHIKEMELSKALEDQEVQLQRINALNQELKSVYRESKLPGSTMLRGILKPKEQKKTILVIEDSEINREILTELLQDEFNILTAENGSEGIHMLKEHREQLSLVLLDVYMPVCNGFEFLEQIQKDPYLTSVPVIVTTGSEEHGVEEKCIHLGATDFITKPYNPEVMIGRIHNVIRLRESISELSIVEFDRLTGLLTMSAFFHHAEQLLAEKEGVYDLGYISVQDFASINRIYGEKKGDEVLIYVAERLKELLADSLLARQANSFFALRITPESFDGEEKLNGINEIAVQGPIPNLRMRQGLYLNVDKSQHMSVLCERARLAASAGTLSKNAVEFSFYQPFMEQKLLEEQKMLLDFEEAIRNHEFVIWIQPKVDIKSGNIVSGEALVRWINKEGKFISPGAFISLFEREGQIQQLDEYVFRTVCAYQHKQIISGRKVVPISVNLSRNSLFRKGIVEIYTQIAGEEKVDLSLVPIEITESSITSEKQIKDICNKFIQEGLLLQMDDFGAGYSSLSALVTLPFNVIKLDKSIIDQIGTVKGDVVIKHAIQIAHELKMKVVAEGVEKQHQVEFLTSVECDQIQGYFYSPPRNAQTFEELLTQKKPFEKL